MKRGKVFCMLLIPTFMWGISFTVENVDAYNADKAAICVDADGFAYLVGNSSGGRDVIRFINNTTGSWYLDSIAFSAETGINYNCRASAALDQNDNLHVVYRVYNSPFGWPVYANNIGGSFTTADTLIHSTSQSSHHYGIALDSQTRAHIVCEVYEGTTFKIVYYYPYADSQLLISNNAIDGSIAVGKNDIVHIVFGYPESQSKMHYTNNAGGEFSTPVLVSDSSGRDPSIAVDTSGYAHICWAQSIGGTSPSDVFYATNKTGAFQTIKAVATPATCEAWPHIALSKDNHVAIGYNCWTSANTSEIWCAHKHADDVTFTSDYVGVGTWNSSYGGLTWNDRGIAIDTLGYIHLTFPDNNNYGQYAKSETSIGHEEKANNHPNTFSALKCSPNPFDNVTYIECGKIPADDSRIEIYNNTGCLVRSITLGNEVVIPWDGTDNNGIRLPAGVYFVVLGKDDQLHTQKILMLR